MADDWKLYLRAPDLTREGQIDHFTTIDAVPRFNDIGTWQLVLPWTSRHALALTTPGYGIELVRNDVDVVMSGPMTKPRREKSLNSNTLTVSGRDDNVWLARRLAHPQPATAAPPYGTNEHNVSTGVASTVLRHYVNVNAGAGALSVRQVTGLSLDVDPLAGSTITGRGRWQVLLKLLQDLAQAGGGLGFRVRKSGGALLFTVYQPADKTSTIRFDEAQGTLAGFVYDREAPEVDYVVAGGGGEGTARTIAEGQSSDAIAQWGRIEAFTDRRDTTDAGELAQEITQALDEGAERVGMSITPIDLDNQKYLADYDLGDQVTAVIDGTPVAEVIREVRLKLDPDGPQQVLPSIGTPGRRPLLKVFEQLRRATARITDLERR